MYRARFYANYGDYRSVIWPVKYPYWCTGYAGDETYSVVVAYVDNQEQLLKQWPEATDIELGDPVDDFVFTSRFEKPDWFVE